MGTGGGEYKAPGISDESKKIHELGAQTIEGETNEVDCDTVENEPRAACSNQPAEPSSPQPLEVENVQELLDLTIFVELIRVIIHLMTSLRLEDIPGAILKNPESIEDLSVLELQRWLECRGLKKVGSEANSYPESKTASRLGILVLMEEVSQFSSHALPKYFNKRHTYTYLIGASVENEDPDMSVVSENNTISTVKPFRRGHQYVDSDHISSVEDGLRNNFNVCRCKCLSFFQKNLQYEVKVILNNTFGAVVKGCCECKQSALGECSHVSALLIFIC
ncbi:hypothetical protein JTB14_028102 [Gonioctena quinquepunctata]|nr:hypothetical protein JTB14_028102 [Gonioctena quinquepunctata]